MKRSKTIIQEFARRYVANMADSMTVTHVDPVPNDGVKKVKLELGKRSLVVALSKSGDVADDLALVGKGIRQLVMGEEP